MILRSLYLLKSLDTHIKNSPPFVVNGPLNLTLLSNNILSSYANLSQLVFIFYSFLFSKLCNTSFWTTGLKCSMWSHPNIPSTTTELNTQQAIFFKWEMRYEITYCMWCSRSITTKCILYSQQETKTYFIFMCAFLNFCLLWPATNIMQI